MFYYKAVNNEIITQIGSGSKPIKLYTEITEEKYNQLMIVVQSKPKDTLETIYYLSAETEEYVGRDTTHDEKVNWYVSAVVSKQMTIDEVPEEYKAEVQAIIDNQGKDLTSEEILTELESEVGING